MHLYSLYKCNTEVIHMLFTTRVDLCNGSACKMQHIPYPMLANIRKESHLTHRLLDNLHRKPSHCIGFKSSPLFHLVSFPTCTEFPTYIWMVLLPVINKHKFPCWHRASNTQTDQVPFLGGVFEEHVWVWGVPTYFRVAITKCPVDDEARLPALDMGT